MWAVYARKSTADERQISVERQREKGLEAVRAMGGDPDQSLVLVDEATSGGLAFAQRPEGRRLLPRLGDLEGIIAMRVDRLTRDVADATELYQRCQQAGVRMLMVEEGEVAFDANGELQWGFRALMAQNERRVAGERVAAMKASHAARGKHVGGQYPWGFTRAADGSLVFDDEEAPLLRECVERVLGGESIGDIREWLDSVGSTTRRGKQWRTKGVREALKPHRLLNQSIYHGELVRDEDGVPVSRGPAIATREEVERVQTLLEPRRQKTWSSDTPAFPTSGLMYCTRCDKPMSRLMPRDKGGTRRIYAHCHRAGATSCGQVCPMPAVEARTDRHVLDALVSEKGVEHHRPSGATNAHDQWRQDYERAQERYRRLLSLVSEGVVSMDGETTKQLRAAQDAIRGLEEAEPMDADALSVARAEVLELVERFEELADEERERLYRLTVQRIDIAPPPEGWEDHGGRHWEEHMERVHVVPAPGWEEPKGNVLEEWGEELAAEYGA